MTVADESGTAQGRAGVAWRVLGWVVLVVVVGWGLGGYPMLEPDEGRNGEVAREMMAGGDYVLPHLDGLPYLDKPVLFFAVDAVSQQVFGVNEAAARLPALLFALGTAALAGWFAGRMFGRRARWVAAVGALVAPLPLAFARTVIFDSALAFFLTLAVCAFYLAVEARVARESYLGWTLLAWGAIGLGVLTKGPVALAVPLLAAAPYAVVRRASRAVWHGAGMGMMALVVGPWIWLMTQKVPEFLHYALVVETWARVTTTQMNREGPIWLYIPCLIAGTLPWSILVLAGWRRSLRPRDEERRLRHDLLYLYLWIAVPFVMFSLTHSKRPQYILPLLPAVAVLAAKVWVDAEEAQPARTLPGARATLITWITLMALCAGGAVYFTLAHPAAAAHATRLPATLAALAAAFLVGAALLAWRQNRRALVVGLVLPIALMPALAVPLVAEVTGHRSSRAAAAALRPAIAAGAQVVGVRAYPPSLPFYLQHTILVASPRGRELTSNYVLAYLQKWMTAPPDQTPLRSFAWYPTALAACDHPLLFVAWTDDAPTRATLSRLPLLYTNDRVTAYGPCTPPAPR